MEHAFFLKSSSLSFFLISDKICYEVADNLIKYLYLGKFNTNISTVLSGGRGEGIATVMIVHGKA